MNQEPYIVRYKISKLEANGFYDGNEEYVYRLKVANNLYSAPCQCKQRVEWANNVHFHHTAQGEWNPKGEMRTYIVDKEKEYPEN
jgi:hypothetical protein